MGSLILLRVLTSNEPSTAPERAILRVTPVRQRWPRTRRALLRSQLGHALLRDQFHQPQHDVRLRQVDIGPVVHPVDELRVLGEAWSTAEYALLSHGFLYSKSSGGVYCTCTVQL